MRLQIPMTGLRSFYKIDASELVLLCGLALTKLRVLTEFCQDYYKLLFKPTSTAFVGELANFCVAVHDIAARLLSYS